MPSSASVKKRHERGQEGHGRGQEQRESNVEGEYCSEGENRSGEGEDIRGMEEEGYVG